VNPIFQRNLDVFLKAHPEYEKTLRNYIGSPQYRVESRSGHSVLLDGNLVMDTTSPYHRQKVDIGNPNVKIAIFFGFGFGNSVKDVALAKPGDKLAYIVIEPNADRFLAGLTGHDLTALLGHHGIIWLIGKTPDEAYNEMYLSMFDIWIGPRRKAINYYINPVLEATDARYIKVIKAQIANATTLFYQSFGDQDDCFLGIRYSIVNLDNMQKTKGLDTLGGVFRGLPAVIPATGPSLLKSIPKLKAVKDQCVIICPDASLKVLIDNGLTPHFVASLERHIDTLKFFKGVKFPKGQPKPTLITFPLSPKETLDYYKGPKLMAYRNYNYYRYFEERWPKGILGCGHSVAHMCCKIADTLGVSKIIVVGQDLCYDPETLQTHAAGVAHGSDKKMTLEELKKYAMDTGKGEIQEVPANMGGTVYTNDLWLYFSKEYITEQQQTEAQIVNCTEGGMKLFSLPWRSITDELKKFPAPRKDTFAKILAATKEGSEDIEIKSLLQELEYLMSLYKKPVKQLKKARRPGMKFKRKRRILEDMENIKHTIAMSKVFLGFVFESDVKLLVGIEEKIYEEELSEKNADVQIDTWLKWFKEIERINKEVIELIREHAPAGWLDERLAKSQ